MSAILNALKKLEQETAETSGHPLQRDIKRRRAWPSLAGLVAVSVFLCGLAGFGVVFLVRKPPVSQVPVASAIDRQTVAPSPAAPVVAPSARPDQSLNPAPASHPFEVKASNKPLAFRGEEKSLPPAGKVIAIPLDSEEMPEETREEPTFAYGSKDWHGAGEESSEEIDEEEAPTDDFQPYAPETKPEVETSPADRQGSDRMPEVVSDIMPDVINDPAVVLQAISWSADAARRMAVINGKICREKEQIGGYVILKINPEDVAVSKGSVSGRLVFQIR